MSIFKSGPIYKHIYNHIFKAHRRRNLFFNPLGAHKRRTYLPAPKASLTLEAAVVLPVFMIFVTALLYLLIILSLQADIRLSMEEAARAIDKEAYLAERTDAELLINPLVIKEKVLTPELRERVDKSHIAGGADGINTLLTTYNRETGVLDIVLSYKYEIPFILPGKIKMDFVQRVESRAWIGKDLKDDGTGKEEGRIVYITPNGVAYHLTKECPYLDLSIRAVAYASVSSLRNKDGAIYYRCTACARKGEFEIVYITDYGTNWHADLSCSGLKRTVIEVDISEVGDRHECSKCGGQS